ncbi:DUF805 domain-containing protein [Sphingopyxis sp. H115]|uniref:DUF805 domain-containing protein n=1 Tax=Sphingopyxis sp. H115 TaxID=1759073 RepID=UPI000736BE09|nr:DUF805 domain-containing protein [Sphingopyxis sp. H115]KTE15538.1 hypothetical protein ATE71_07285 [Sphingopyxis sp. H115]
MLRAALKDGYLGLFRFSGRMALGPFWIYAGINMLFGVIAQAILFDPYMKRMAGEAQRIAQEHPDDVTIQSGPGHYSVEIRGNHSINMPDIDIYMAGMALIGLIFFLLMAAATMRRLHDSDRRGWWILLPVPFVVAAVSLAPSLLNGWGMEATAANSVPDFGPFLKFAALTGAYMLSLVVLMFLLALSGTKGPNRFGDPPQGSV